MIGAAYIPMNWAAAQNSLFKEHPLLCEDTESVGFNSHVQCYVDGGFCRMNTRDKLRIAVAIRRELMHPKTHKIRREISRRCTK